MHVAREIDQSKDRVYTVFYVEGLQNFGRNFLCTISTTVRDDDLKTKVHSRALLDSGAQVNAISKRLVDELNAKEIETENYRIKGFKPNEEVVTNRAVKVWIGNRKECGDLRPIDCLVIENCDWTVPVPSNLPKWLKNIQDHMADPEILTAKDLPFELLIGNADCMDILGDKIYSQKRFVIQDSKFGLVLGGTCPGVFSKGPEIDRMPISDYMIDEDIEPIDRI